MTARAHPGWSSARHLREPFFRQILGIYTLFGFVVGLVYYFFHKGLIPYEIKDFHVLSTYIVVFGGGLYIHGELTTRRALLILAAAAIDQIWLYHFWNAYPINLLNVLVGNWLFVWLIWSDPELMDRFGLRRRHLVRDIPIALGLGLLMIAYLLPLLTVYDFDINLNARHVLTYAVNALPQNLLNYSVMFSVWHRLEQRGISQLQGLAAITAMVCAQQFFTWIGLGLSGFLPVGLIAGASFSVVMMLVLTFGITFRVFRNTLPAVSAMAAIQICLVMIGRLE